MVAGLLHEFNAARTRQVSFRESKAAQEDEPKGSCAVLSDVWDPGWDKSGASKGIQPCDEWVRNMDWGALRKGTSGQLILGLSNSVLLDSPCHRDGQASADPSHAS